ncbi:MAG: alpha/beta fold hydrolase [Rhodocyclaceae bacterium]|nr:alpha/beta fold hydrolase [Rhodocyclaceae bacterium]
MHRGNGAGGAFSSGWQSMGQAGRAIEGAMDPIGVAMPLIHAQLAWWAHPMELTAAAMKLMDQGMALQRHFALRSLGVPSAEPIMPHRDDARFSDPVWRSQLHWDLIKDTYLMLTRSVQDMLYETPGMSARERRRAAFWWRTWLNAMAPSNFLFTNPVALRKAIETNGESLRLGFENFLDDLKAGSVRLADPSDFSVGGNLATTPGKVVFRNRLLEVIHYRPTCEKVLREPVVIVTPWINKFYILDLKPKKSMVRYLLDQGLDVYITSWKNPDASMADIGFDDYLIDGIGEIVRVARELSGAPKVHAVGYCIGGTALAMYVAWANRHFGEKAMPIADWTLFTTLVDFQKPGDIEVFIDPQTVRYLSQTMARQGYLDGKEMATSFRLLRSNSLIWHYVVHGWLYGEKPPAFDVLYWNMDTTRMPARMHAWYLEELYMKNRLVQANDLEIAGERIDLGCIRQPLYAVGAEDDHIAPWRQTFRIMDLLGCPRRYVLSSSGHILGIVNPPTKPPKREYVAAEVKAGDSQEAWHHRGTHEAGSWWGDWMAWLKPRCGEWVAAPPVATEVFPALADAPGRYVLER